jgi:hypothetical protein
MASAGRIRPSLGRKTGYSFWLAGSCPAIKSFNFVVHHSRDMDIVDADKLLIYEICHHYLAFDTDGMISFSKVNLTAL